MGGAHREWLSGLSVRSRAGHGSGGFVRTASQGRDQGAAWRAGPGRGAVRAAPDVGDGSETDACDPWLSLETKQLFREFHMLYQERLRQLEIMDDAQEEVLRVPKLGKLNLWHLKSKMKVRLLQSYVMDLSDQNNVLVQTMEELERETEWKVAALEAELQEYVARVTEHKQENCTLQITKAELQKEISCPSLAQRPVPTEHLSGSTATQITVAPPEQMIEQEELRVQMASKELFIHQLNVHLREANHSQEKSKAEVLEKEAQIQELQELITDLHHEIYLKDSETVNQLQEKHLLQTTLQSLRQLLDTQEQRIYQLQTKQTERQAELEQKCSWIQQLRQDLEASSRLQEESQRQIRKTPLQLQAAERSTALQSLQEAHQALKLRTAEQEGHRKKDLAKLQGAEEQVCGREQSTVELRGDLKTAEEALTRTKDEGTERAAEVGGLKGKLHRRPEDMLSLQETCGERGKAMAEQTCCMQQLQHEQEIGISQGQTQALGVEQLQGELDSCQQAQQPDLEQLRAKLQHLQQELDGCKEKNQADVSRLQQRECMAERQSWALESLRQQCQALKDEGLYYEEVVQKQERELCQQQEQLREAQEQLARAESQSQARASSLALYKEKYQACLARAGELEGQVQRLEEDLQDVSSQQAATGRGGQRATEQLPQALHTSEAELCRSRPHAQRCEQSIQGLREPLAAGHTTRLADETLVNVQTEFASYTATHSQGNASYERQAAVVETRQQKLGQAEGECARHSQRAEEYQSLAQDLTLELARVTEQKNSARKDLGTLERQVQSLRQDVAAEGSRVQQLERELRASRRLCAQQEQVVQSRDEQLRQARAQSQAGSGALREETRLLRRSLQGSQQQQQETARELAQQEQRLLLAQSSLQSAQEQLRQRQAELRALQERVSRSEDEAAQSRKRLAQRAAELSQWQQRLQGALQQGQQQQQRAAELELKLQRSQEQARALEQQLREQDATQQQLREELRRLQGREDAWQRQLQGAQGRVHVLQGEREELQRKATALARLQEELGAAQAGERQSSRQLAAAEATLQELTLKAASCHEHQRQALEQLREKTQEALALQAALVRTQHREAQLEAGTLAHKERLKRLNGELKKLQGFQQQSEQEARSCAEQLGQRSSQAQHWQRRHRASAQALAQRDEELLVCKVELASLQEKLHGATDERDRLQQELNSLRQTFVASSSEAEALRSALGAARSHSRRLQRESELVLANVSQWVKEQKQANEKLGHKIRAQIKHIARLTGEKEHLQEGLVQLQRENRRLQGAVAARRVEGERLQALHSSSSDEGAGPRPPWALLLGEE